MNEAEFLRYPFFIKPVIPKLFRAGVYKSVDELREECEGLDSDTVVFVSDIVTFTSEARAFVLEGKVLDCAFYEGSGSKEEAAKAAGDFAQGSAASFCIGFRAYP